MPQMGESLDGCGMGRSAEGPEMGYLWIVLEWAHPDCSQMVITILLSYSSSCILQIGSLA